MSSESQRIPAPEITQAESDVDAETEEDLGLELAGPKPDRGSWSGSYVSRDDIEWLRRSRRIPPNVDCRRPGDEIVPTPRAGERLVFVSHFIRGFGLPVSTFMREFLDEFKIQPHHLPANGMAILSSLTAFTEGYLGIAAS